MKKISQLYRMVTDDHICPFGIKSKDLLRREGYAVEDHLLTTREEADAFKGKHQVKTTPQTFIDGLRIGGHDDLLEHFGKSTPVSEGLSYQPVIAIFGTTLLMAIAATHALVGELDLLRIAELFIAFSMCVLAVMKLRDLESFSNQFITYDFLAQRVLRYAYVYPFVELAAGVLMIAGWMTGLAASMALFIGVIGGASVFKAVYIDKRDLKCACVGGDSKVPLGFISLTENIMMVGMGIWILFK